MSPPPKPWFLNTKCNKARKIWGRKHFVLTCSCLYSGIRIRLDPLIFGPPDPDSLLFSLDPDPTCNNGLIKLFSSLTKYKPESTNASWKWFKFGSVIFFHPIRIQGKNVGNSSLQLYQPVRNRRVFYRVCSPGSDGSSVIRNRWKLADKFKLAMKILRIETTNLRLCNDLIKNHLCYLGVCFE